MSQQQITDAETAAALAAGRAEMETEIRAQAVRYTPDHDVTEIVMTRNAITRQLIGALQDVPTEDLTRLEIWPDVTATELEERGIHISVHGLLSAVLPAMQPPRTLPAIFASGGARTTWQAKRQSAQVNGRKGGRPKKSVRDEFVA